MILKIKEVPLITPRGEVKGTELVTQCPRFLSKVNVKKSCTKCPYKISLSYKKLEVDCKIADRIAE